MDKGLLVNIDVKLKIEEDYNCIIVILSWESQSFYHTIFYFFLIKHQIRFYFVMNQILNFHEKH